MLIFGSVSSSRSHNLCQKRQILSALDKKKVSVTPRTLDGANKCLTFHVDGCKETKSFPHICPKFEHWREILFKMTNFEHKQTFHWPRVPGAGHNVLLVHVHTPHMVLMPCQGPNLSYIITRMGWCPRTGWGQQLMIRTAVNEFMCWQHAKINTPNK